ncbi:MAG: crossover junction endodeoxyribonuclease RuvC [Gemmataceae bacterium]
MSILLGLDPGLQTTGYGVIDTSGGAITFREAGVIRSEAGEDDLARRVRSLYEGVNEVLEEWKPSAVAVEQLYAHYEHPRTAILMGHARGVLILACAEHDIDVISYAATKVKKLITGNGRASKEQMQNAVTRELGLSKIPEPHDAADALALALCHAYAAGGVHGKANARYTGVNLKALHGESE